MKYKREITPIITKIKNIIIPVHTPIFLSNPLDFRGVGGDGANEECENADLVVVVMKMVI